MYQNVLVNSHMEIDDLHEGGEVICLNGPGLSTEGPNRWYAQLDAVGAEARLSRVTGAGAKGSLTSLQLTMTRAANDVVGLDRVQLFQPIAWDELFGLSAGNGSNPSATVPLVMRFSIKTNIDIEIGCTLNSGTATRNWTTNRNVRAGEWTHINIQIPGDHEAPWTAGPGNFGLYFQVGLSCGPVRLSEIDSVWNPGHYLMLANSTSSKFLMTEGATAWLTACALGVATSEDAILREPPPIARLRTQRYREKSYRPGIRPGTPNSNEGAYQIRARDSFVEDRIEFKVLKSTPPSGTLSKIYSPVTGVSDHAHDTTSQQDVPASIIDVSCSHMIVLIPNTIAGRVYRYHWLAET